MKVLVERFQDNSNFIRISTWVKLAGTVGIFQLLIQAIGFACGIIVIRLLPTEEYALYTLANTTLGAMIILADGGIASGVMAQGGRVWQDREKLGVVLATGLDLRKKFAIASLLVFLPALLYLLHYHGASWPKALLIASALIPAFFATLSGTLFGVVPKLAQHITPLQKVELGASIGRLACLGAGLFFFPLSFVALLSAGLPQFWANVQLRSIATKFVDKKQKVDATIRSEILVMVKRLLPEAIYYCLSGQITVWVISILGSTTAVAQIGALGRVAIVFTLAGALISTLIVPRFARLPGDSATLLKRYLQIQAILILISGAVILAAWVLSSEILLVLGSKYAGLSKELVLLLIGSSLAFNSGHSFYLCNSRGWVINPFIPIGVSLLSIAIGASFLNIASLSGVLIFNIFIAVPQVVVYFIYSLIRISKSAD